MLVAAAAVEVSCRVCCHITVLLLIVVVVVVAVVVVVVVVPFVVYGCDAAVVHVYCRSVLIYIMVCSCCL